MSYSTIDPIISRWARRHGLHVYTTCKDEEVRAIRVTDQKGRTYGIGIDPPNAQGTITVRAYAWDFKKRHREYVVSLPELELCLENLWALLVAWMHER